MESQSLRSWKNKKTISNIHLAKILSEHAKHVKYLDRQAWGASLDQEQMPPIVAPDECPLFDVCHSSRGLDASAVNKMELFRF